VEVGYNARIVRIACKGSDNLNYSMAANTIHGTCNRWVRFLNKNIRENPGAC
jgi:hypothetical protein